jgi:hypothetical protein
MANPSLPILRLHIKKRNQALIKVTAPEVISTRVFGRGVFCWSENTISPMMLTATMLFIQARMKNHVQTVELDILRKKLGSLDIF